MRLNFSNRSLPPMVRVSTEEDHYESSHTPPRTSSPSMPIQSNLTRCQSMKSPKRTNNKDLRSTAILRSASGTKLNKLDDHHIEDSQPNSQESLSKTPPPSRPMATLAIRRDSFNMNQGKSRSMTCLLASWKKEERLTHVPWLAMKELDPGSMLMLENS